ncbi:MAG: CDP-alcohol phosphatidyltransferase family protein [Deltaproteobacteria bacterium]|nr:MAG: CDP-alcohol phosphatidyltransferase family protein [Deltaproteobacteria bacterium]
MSWRTKPTDRFILRFIKTRLSAPVSRALVRMRPGVSPNLITLANALLGVTAGVLIGFGRPLAGAAVAAAAQVLDGVDGQVARITGRVTDMGAFYDSVLDRYVDFSMLFGLLVLQLNVLAGIEAPAWAAPVLMVVAAAACAGASQVSYTTARAKSLGIDYRRPELVGKGTRASIEILAAAAQPLWPLAPAAGLLLLAVVVNAAVLVAVLGAKEGKEK